LVSKFTPEERERIRAESRRLLEELAEMRPHQCAAEDAAEAPTWPRRRDFLDPMTRSSEPLQRWKREAEAFARKVEQETAARKRREGEHIRRQQQAAERAARLEMTEEWTKTIGTALGMLRARLRDEFAEQLGQLRAELDVQRAHDAGQVVDVPAIPLQRRSNAA
jgi:hypothetical protein